MVVEWCSSRSRMAEAIATSGNRLAQSEKDLLEVIMWNMGILSRLQGSLRWGRWLEEADREAQRLWLRDRSSLLAGPFRVRGSAPEPPKFS